MVRVLWISCIIITVVAVGYIAVLVDTDPLMRRMGEVMRGEVPYEETFGRPEALYNISKDLPDNCQVAEFEIERRFVLHNFFDGYIWLHYKIKIVDENGRSVYGGIASSCWKIHKEDGVWHIIEIYEKP